MLLPNKPSELIDLALADLELCEKDEEYQIDMEVYYDRSISSKVCQVCLAGAVMAQSLERYSTTLFPSSFDCDTSNKLSALDMFRKGSLRTGLRCLSIEPIDTSGVHITPYEDNSVQFKRDMWNLARFLERTGI